MISIITSTLFLPLVLWPSSGYGTILTVVQETATAELQYQWGQ